MMQTETSGAQCVLLCSVPEAAERLGVSKSYVWELVRAGRLHTVRLGKRVLVPTAALAEFVNNLARHSG